MLLREPTYLKKEIDSIVKVNPNISVLYTKSAIETQSELVKLAVKFGNSAYYYNSGAPFVITSVKKVIIEERH